MSELVKVYSPSGEVFENSPANARDLVVHAGWTYDKVKTATAIPAPVVVETAVEVKVEEPAVETVVEEEKIVEAPEAAAEEVVVEDEADEDDSADEEVKPAATRGRKKKS